MMWFVVLCMYVYFDCTYSSPSLNRESIVNHSDVGEALFLTPYIEAGKVREGQEAARVHLPGINITSYSGFLTANKSFNSNIFFWFFPSEKSKHNAPVLLWLQGGPGASSMIGIFMEHGPFYIDKDSLKERQYYWCKLYNVIYMDNPVGTGFSFTEEDAGYATDQAQVGRDIYSALTQFFQLFPHLQKNEFFLSGESYAGKYIPAVGYTIHTNNKVNSQKINLKGLAIGNGFTDPENMMVFADHMYQIGIIDSKTRDTMRREQDLILENIRRKDFIEARNGYYELFILIYKEAGNRFSIYNYLQPPTTNLYQWKSYLESDETRRCIYVGNLTFQERDMVAWKLENDFMQSVKPWFEVLLENYRVMFYSGQLDVIVSYPFTVNFVRNLNWSGAEMYRTAPRKRWMVEGELAGFAKSVKGFSEVLVRNAGHLVPKDQPKFALDLITRFVNNVPF